VCILVGLVLFRSSVRDGVGLLTGVSIFVVGRMDRLETLLAYRPLQHLGRISYSLYLVHPVFGDPIVYYFRRSLFGPTSNTAVDSGLFALACGVSILAAHLMYRFIEKPSVELAKRFKSAPTHG